MLLIEKGEHRNEYMDIYLNTQAWRGNKHGMENQYQTAGSHSSTLKQNLE